MKRFMAFLFVEFTFYDGDSLCISTGDGIEEVLLNIETSMQFWDCYKNLIYTLCGFDNFNGNLLDSCGFSEDEQIDIYEWNPVEEEELNYQTGSSDYSTECDPGKLTNPAMTTFIFNALQYFATKSSKK